MKHRVPGILIFCVISAVTIGALYITVGVLLSGIQAQVTLSVSYSISTYFIVCGSLSVISAGPCIYAGFRFAKQRTLSGWFLIVSGVFNLPSVIGLLTAIPLFKSASDVFKAEPPFHNLFTLPKSINTNRSKR